MPLENRTEVIEFKEFIRKRKGTVSCCIITRDEGEFIAGAIRSVKDLVDEVIVVDTGSTDGTVPEARKHGAKVYEIKWTDDFSEARNYALSKATREWILVLDADEEIAGNDHYRIRELIERHPEGAFLFEQWTYTDEPSTFGWRSLDEDTGLSRGGSGYFASRQVRLFKNENHIRFRGGIHEDMEDSLRAAGVPMYTVDLVIHHYGRLKKSGRVYRKYLTCLSTGRKKLESNPGGVKYIYEMAAQLLTLGNTDEAIDHIKTGLDIEPDSWQFLNIFGLALLKKGCKGESLKHFLKAVEREKQNPDLYNNLGVALLENDDPARALQSLEEGLKLDAEHASLLRNSASACIALGKIKEASDYISRSLRLDPFMPQSHVIQAEVLYRLDDLQGTLDALGRIRFLPGMPLKVYLKSIYLYLQMKMVREADEVVSRAVEEYPGYDGLAFLSGKISEMKGDDRKAVSIFLQLLAVNPDNPDVHNSLGCVYERQGKLEEALKSFREAVRLSPLNLQIEVNLGIVLGKLGLKEEAERRLRCVIEKKNDYGIAHNALGCYLANQNRYRESIFHFTRAVELEPSNVNFHMNLGLACEKINMQGKD